MGVLVGVVVFYVCWLMWLCIVVVIVVLVVILLCGVLIDGVKEFLGLWVLVFVGVMMLMIFVGVNW